MSDRIAVLLVDDHVVVRKALAALLRLFDDIDVVGEAEDGRAALERACALAPDVVLMDLMLPVLDGVGATRALTEIEGGPRVVVLSCAGLDRVLQAVRAGAMGYVPKSATAEELVQAVRNVHRGEPWLPPAFTRRLLESWGGKAVPVHDLTRRETTVLRLVAQGFSNTAIGERLGISEATVRTHLTRVFDKIGAVNRVEAALIALRDGVTTVEECLEARDNLGALAQPLPSRRA
jgi:NarL family two-component system response regulator LiaR